MLVRQLPFLIRLEGIRNACYSPSTASIMLYAVIECLHHAPRGQITIFRTIQSGQ